MKKNTQTNLSKKLLQYGALSAAVMGVADASGQIVYTDIADVTIAPTDTNAFVNLDIDNNGVNDFQIANDPDVAVMLPINPAGTAIGGPNGFVGFTSGNFNYPSNLVAGVTVDSNNNVIGAQGTLQYGAACAYSSDWCGGVTDGYAGIVIDIAGATHYGWIRMDLATDRSTLVVKDYAYNSVADEPIETGQLTLGVSENSINDFSYIVDAAKNLNISSASTIETVKIYSVLGKEVATKTLNANSGSLSLSNLSTGIYIAKATAEGKIKSFKFVVK